MASVKLLECLASKFYRLTLLLFKTVADTPQKRTAIKTKDRFIELLLFSINHRISKTRPNHFSENLEI